MQVEVGCASSRVSYRKEVQELEHSALDSLYKVASRVCIVCVTLSESPFLAGQAGGSGKSRTRLSSSMTLVYDGDLAAKADVIMLCSSFVNCHDQTWTIRTVSEVRHVVTQIRN